MHLNNPNSPTNGKGIPYEVLKINCDEAATESIIFYDQQIAVLEKKQ